jgi:hypothetical protein
VEQEFIDIERHSEVPPIEYVLSVHGAQVLFEEMNPKPALQVKHFPFVGSHVSQLLPSISQLVQLDCIPPKLHVLGSHFEHVLIPAVK